MPKLTTPINWYGALVMPDGVVQCVTAYTVPRPLPQEAGRHHQEVLIGTQPETTYELMTDPVRASWPSR